MKSTQQFLSDVNDVALRFFFLSLGAAAAGCLQQGCWSYTGARQSNRLRSRFLQAVLKQDIAFYDTQATTGQQQGVCVQLEAALLCRGWQPRQTCSDTAACCRL
jgi:ABC-type multidrug transport system fused ATPase/permease subunit